MPHRRRDTAAGTFHVYTHCVWAAPALFRDDVDWLNFIRRLAELTMQGAWRCISFCLLGTHYHLMLEVEDGALPVGMHRLNLGYARDFNRRHALRGHVQFRRYGATRVGNETQLVSTFAYVARNPVEAGLCASPGDWPWSSYAGTVGLATPHSFVDATAVLRCFEWADDDARLALRRLVEGI